MIDYKLTYEQALHGVQSAVAFDMSKKGIDPQMPVMRYIKHLRTGVDMSKSDMCGLVALLIDKGIIKKEEYIEAVRLAANNEVAFQEQAIEKEYGIKVSFR